MGHEARRELEVEGRRLLSFEFVGLCLVAFLALCNVTVFYDLFGHLASLGIPADLRGVVVGSYSLTATVLYVVGSPFLGVRRAPAAMLAGIAILAVTGWSYLAVHSFWGLLAVRVVNGAGYFLLGGGATALLVGVIPPGRSGQAFGIYSVAILVAFGLVPAILDAVRPHLPSAAHGYAAATLTLLPAAWLVRRIAARTKRPAGDAPHAAALPWSEVRANLAARYVWTLVLLCLAYFANWSGLFYLYEGWALRKGVATVGPFFVVLTGVMIAIRLLAGPLFDRFDKVRLLATSFGLISVAHLALGRAPVGALPLVGALFGVGLGAGYPALNGLAFERSPPHLRAFNANLMLAAVQGGNFLGPAIGGALVARLGYGGYFLASVGMALAAALATGTLALGRRSPEAA